MSLTRDKPYYYNTQLEIFMALKDVHSTFTLTSSGDLKSSPTVRNQQITVYWRPPGAMQWIEKYKSEMVHGKSNLQFAASLLIDLDIKDAPAISLKFEIRQQIVVKKSNSAPDVERREEMVQWSVIHTTVDKIMAAGPKGADLLLTLDFGVPETPSQSAKQSLRSMPGYLFLRGEVLQTCGFGLLLQFGIQCDRPASDYFIEFHKLNQENAFELSHPYTLEYRSELDESLPSYPTSTGKRIYFPEARLSNGDSDRVLKVDIYKKETFERKGFALTTLGSLLKEQSQIIKVDRIDSQYPYAKKDMKVIIKLFAKLPNHPLEYYFNQGWKIIPVFCVDYSRSNWNETMHKRALHDSSGRTPYEEGVEYVAEAINIIATGHAVFYGFGCPANNTYMNVYRPSSHCVQNALKNYNDALCLRLMSALSVSQDRSPFDGASSSKSSSGSSASASSPLLASSGGSMLSPLFNDLVTLITARTNAFEYFTVLILTDGQFTDCMQYMSLLKELSLLPVSLIFIGIGLGDFRLLLDLEQAWITPLNGMFLSRKFVHLIHFRSKAHWEAALTYEKYRSTAKEIFTKEVLTTVQEQCVDYFKRYFVETKK